MYAGDINFRVLHFDQLESSNIHAQEMIKKGEMSHADVIWTDYQKNGKGQKLSGWDSNPSENLLFSIYLQLNWPADKLFQFNKLTALAIRDLLVKLAVPKVAIKWPNDILAGSSKLCGILIENVIQSNKAIHTIIGIGLNVNQISFPDFERSASSLAKELGRTIKREELLRELLSEFKKRLDQLTHNQTKLDKDYQEMLYGSGRSMQFESRGEIFSAQVQGVDQSGRLLLQKGDEQLSFDLKEIHFKD